MDYEHDARRALRAVGEQVRSNGLGPCAFGLALHASAHHGAGTPQIRSNGLPAAFAPLVICVAGTGNVSRGAIDAIKALGDDVIEWVSAAEGHCDDL